MKREIQVTADGSPTISIPEKNITYHSIYGAMQESRHVFTETGLQYVLSRFSLVEKECIRVFEMGLGTGLNALLSYNEMMNRKQAMYYEAVELYPLSLEEVLPLHYIHKLRAEKPADVFSLLHQSQWNEDVILSPFFTLHKSKMSLLDVHVSKLFHLIYFDAFAPDIQPELWTPAVFEKMYNILYENGVLVTYCSKGTTRRAMQAAGFMVEKLPGPPGKREIVRVVKRM